MSVPRWRRVIENALEQDSKAAIYQLATIERSLERGTVPKVRSLVHRDFVTPLTEARPLLLTTTDIRTPKVSQLTQNDGRNVNVELAWWFPTTQEQLRIAGNAHILPSPNFKLSSNSPALDGAMPLEDRQREEIEDAAREVRKEFEGWADGLGDKVDVGNDKAKFDWEKERRRMFESMSGHMRASWVRPIPGSRLVAKGAEAWSSTLPKLSEAEAGGDEHTLELVKKAFTNFALVVIEPSRIDYVELGVVPNRRTIFEKNHEEGGWIEQAVAP